MVTQLTKKFRRKLEQMAQYTEKAQEALVLASEAAEDMGSPVIGTEHILVGLIEGEAVPLPWSSRPTR